MAKFIFILAKDVQEFSDRLLYSCSVVCREARLANVTYVTVRLFFHFTLDIVLPLHMLSWPSSTVFLAVKGHTHTDLFKLK